MDLSFAATQALSGLASASSLFLIASGLTIVFGVTRIVNFAHGSLYMLGAYLAVTVVPRLLDAAYSPWMFALGVLASAVAVASLFWVRIPFDGASGHNLWNWPPAFFSWFAAGMVLAELTVSPVGRAHRLARRDAFRPAQ